MADSYLVVIEAADGEASKLPTPIPRLIEVSISPKVLDNSKVNEVRIDVQKDHVMLKISGTNKRLDFLDYDKNHPVFESASRVQ